MCHFLPALFCLPLLIYKCYEMYFKGNTFQDPRLPTSSCRMQADKSWVRQASARSPSPTQSRGAVRSLHSKGKFFADHMPNIPDDATPAPIRAERKDKSGSPHMEWGANSNSSSLTLTQPGAAAMADFRVTTGHTRTMMHKGPEAAAFPVVSCNTKAIPSDQC